MNPKLLLGLALVLSAFLVGCTTDDRPDRQYILTSDASTERGDILSYSKPSPETMRNIKVSRIPLGKELLEKLSVQHKDNAIRDVRWLVEEKPDTHQPGPRNTTLYIFDAADTNHCLRVDLLDNHGRVDHRWLNGKMLFVEVWFGRIAWTDFILNTETLKFAYIEDIRLDPMPDESDSMI